MRKPNITVKFIGYLIVFTIVPLLALGLISVRVATQVLTDEYRNFTAELVQNEQRYLDLQLEQVESLIANISGVEEITNALSDTGSSDAYTNLATQARIGYILNGYLNLRGLVSIEIFTLGGNHYHVGDTLDIDNIQNDIKDKIYTEALESNKNILWVGIEDNVNGNSVHEKVLVAAKIIRHTNRETLEQEPVGLLLVNYSNDDFYEHYDQINIGEDAYFMVVDTKSRIIYHPDYDNLGAKVNQSFLDKLDSETGILTTDIGGVSTFVTYTKSARSDWYILSLVPVHTINAKTRLIRIMVFSLLLLGITFIAFSAYLISKNLVTPIRQVTDQFKQFQEGKLDYSTRLKPSSDDEIGQLVVWFNAFVESLAAYEEAKKQLSNSEERYALAVKGANDGLWDWDLLNNEIYLSQRWKQILGYEEDEIGTNPDEWLGRIHSDCRAQVQVKLDGHIQGKTSHFESEHRLRHKDNTYRWVLARGLVLFNEKGVAYRMAGSHTEITIRKQTEEKLRRDAFYDILTGLPNRALFTDRLDKAIQRTQRTPEAQFAVLFLDLDHFKLVNDSLGHNIGDILLQKVAQRLLKRLRSADTFARLGGDEFGILLYSIKGIRDATQIADNIQDQLRQPFYINGNTLITSASIGIMTNMPEYTSPEEYLRDSDVAMYRAKTKGKACYEIFDQTMRDQVVRRMELENDLRSAIENKNIFLYYQPIVHLESRKVSGFEGLLRWHHPEKGNIEPSVFIPIAEDTGLIIPLENWVIAEAAKQSFKWQSEFSDLAKLLISINISGKHLVHLDFLPRIENTIQQYNLEPHSLSIEVTEGDIISDTDTTVAVLKKIRELGVKVQMDDFGTGYSSLSYLHQFPFDIIKIDRSFVQGMLDDTSKVGLIRTIILMAMELKKDVIAEGIETQEELEKLISLGCKYGQGYYFSKALNAVDATAFLEKALKKREAGGL